MDEVSRLPADLLAGFVNSLKIICKNNNNTEDEIIVSDPRQSQSDMSSLTLTNVNKDISLDVSFNSSAITIFFNKYKINPYQLHRGCKLVAGDVATLALTIPIGVSQRIIDATISYVCELVFDSFNRSRFTT